MAAGTRTRGHPAASAAIGAMVRGRPPHAILLIGPSGVGKTTLADDLAAGLLCTAPDPADRPCGSCRSCRLVASGGHPDVHRLRPEGPARQIGIGGPGSKVRGVRDLVADLALLPVEGGVRLGIIESAQRLNDDAQAALLKTLEEPPSGVVLVLCADTEASLLPTIRSRCARLRLGPLAVRDIEAILVEAGIADAPTAARLARVAAGRPGVAVAWASDRDALIARDELGRTLLDQLAVGPAERLVTVRAAAGRAALLAAVGERAAPTVPATRGPTRRAGKGATPTPTPEPPADDQAAADEESSDAAAARTPASERRRAAEALVERWTDLARDVALCQVGLAADVRDLGLMDEVTAAAAALASEDVIRFLDRLGQAGVQLRGNVSPELVLDDLAVQWPRPRQAA